MAEREPGQTRDLFDGLAVDYGKPYVSKKRARALVQRVEDLFGVSFEFEAATASVASEAIALGAYSVARAVRWLAMPAAFERHGIDGGHIRAERVARNWLARVEAEAMNTTTEGGT